MDLEKTSSSQLVKRLRDASRVRPRSIGFGRGRDEEKTPPAMVLAVEVDGPDEAAARSAVEAGAAAVLFRLDADGVEMLLSGDGSLQAAARACGEAIPGVAFAFDVQVPPEAPARVADAGFDFFVAPVQRAPASLLASEAVARVPIVEASQTASLLRALGEMAVDAIYVTPPEGRRGATELTMFDLMHYKQVVELVRQPVLVAAEQNIRPEDLQALRDLGVEGVVLPAASLGAAASDRVAALQRFAAAVAKLKVTRRSSRSAEPGVFLPRSGPAATGQEQDDEDEE